MMKRLFKIILLSFCLSVISSFSAEASTIDSLNEYLKQLQFNDYYSVEESPTSYSEAGTESVSSANGSLCFVKTDLSLPGKGGFDLNLTRRLSSAVSVNSEGNIYYANVGTWLYRNEERKSYKYIFKYYINGDKSTTPIYIAYDSIDDMLNAENGTNSIVVSQDYTSANLRTTGKYVHYRLTLDINDIGMTDEDGFYVYSDLPIGEDVALVRDIESSYASLNFDSEYIYEFDFDSLNASYFLPGGWTYDIPSLTYDSKTVVYKYLGEEVDASVDDTKYDETTHIYSYTFTEPATGRTLRIEVEFDKDEGSGKIYAPYEYVYYYSYSNAKARKLSTIAYSAEMDWNMKKDEAYIYITNDKGIKYKFGTAYNYPKLLSATDRYGNVITFEDDIITDTMGRTINISPKEGIYVNGKKVIKFESVVENNPVVDPNNIFVEDDTRYYKVSALDGDENPSYGTTTYEYRYGNKKWYIGTNDVLPFPATFDLNTNLITKVTLPTGAQSKYAYIRKNVDSRGGEETETNSSKNMKEEIILLSSRWDEVDGEVKNKVNYSYNFTDRKNKCTTKTYENFPGYASKEYFDIDNYLIKSVVQNSDEGNSYCITKEYKNTTSELGERIPKEITTTTSTVPGGEGNVVVEKFEHDSRGNVVKTYRDEKLVQTAYYSTYNIPMQEFNCKDDTYLAGTYNTFTSDGKSIAKSYVARSEISTGGVTKYDYSSYTYTANGDVSSISEKGVTTQIDYEYATYDETNPFANSLKKISTVKNVYTITGANNSATQMNIVTEEVYDWLGRLISIKDAKGNVTEYEYDGRGNVIKTTNPDGSIVTNEYDYINNILISTDESDKKTKYEFDSLGFNKKVYLHNGQEFVSIMERNYDSQYNLTDIIILNEDSTTKGKSSFTYYSDKTPASERVIEGETLISKKEYASYPYHSDNVVMKETRVYKNPDDFVTVSQYTDKYGYKTKDTILLDDKLYQQTYETDYLGNIISTKDFRANDEGLDENSVEYTYDYANRVLKETTPSGTITNTYSSTNGLLTKLTDARGNSISYSYDKMGRLLSESSTTKKVYYYYDAMSNQAQIRTYTDSNAFNITKNVYDNRGRLSAVITIPNTGEENVVKYSYDASGKLLSVAEGLESAEDTPSKDSHRMIEYEYDVYGNMISETDPMGQKEKYTYDFHGNLIQSEDKNGTLFTYTYDILSRPLSKSYTAENGETDSVSYTYDMLGNMLSMIDNQGEILYNYDELGNMLSEISGSTSKTYTYDSNGNMLSYQLSTDDEVKQNITYSYDLSNRVAQITDGTVVTAYTYDANGNILTENVKDGTITKKSSVFEYNSSNLPTYKKVTTGSDYEEYNMTYDLMGNMLTVTTKTYDDKSKSSSTDSAEYTYDGANRLTKETYSDGNSIEYSYDEFGNMSTKVNGDVTSTYSYDKNNRLTEQTVTSSDSDAQNIIKYLYDCNGNMVSKITNILNPPYDPKSTLLTIDQDNYSRVSLYEYDKWNRLSKSTTDKGEATYTYRGDNLRDSKTVVKDGESETTTFVYNGMDIVYEANDDISNTYSRGLLGITFRTDGQNQQSFFRTNQHGDVSSITDTEGNLLTNYQYDAYGNIISDILENDTNPFAYCGEYLDKETGLIYLRNRYYDPEVGRFITQDPIKDGLNWYSYCGGNPVMFLDTTGMFSVYIAPNLNYKIIKNFAYDRIKAVEYAKKYNVTRNPDYPSYSSNCANYVSQCLVNGGLPTDNIWKTYWLPILGTKTTREWDNARRHFNYFSDQKNGFVKTVYEVTSDKVSELANSGNVKQGDLIYFSRTTRDGIYHAALIVRVENGEIYYMQNSGPEGERNASSYTSNMYIVTLKDKGDDIIV